MTRSKHSVLVAWHLDDAADTREVERLCEAARAAGWLYDFDDGRGRDPWYHAERGDAERALRAKCIALLGRPPDEVSV